MKSLKTSLIGCEIVQSCLNRLEPIGVHPKSSLTNLNWPKSSSYGQVTKDHVGGCTTRGWLHHNRYDSGKTQSPSSQFQYILKEMLNWITLEI